MQHIIIIQARTGSSRIPKKVLKYVNGKPLLQFTIERIKLKNPNSPLMVCTSDLEADLPIYALCEKLAIPCFQGSHLNVASRFYEISKEGNFDAFVRVCADSPMIDGELVKTMLDSWSPRLDLLTNKSPRTLPKGQTIDIINRNRYVEFFPHFHTEEDFEHVTHYFHRNLHCFKYKNFSNRLDQSNFSLAIDEPEDLINFERFVTHVGSEWIELSSDQILEHYKDLKYD